MTRVSEIVAANREPFLAELSELLRIPSLSGDRTALQAAADWIATELRSLGAAVRLFDTGDGPPIVFAELGQGPRSLLSYTHYDVQPPDPLIEWTTPPFQPTVRTGNLYGRGTSDDKGDTVARLQAVKIYRQAYGELPLRLKFFVEGEEEVGSPHLEPVAAEHGGLLRADGALWEGGGFDDVGRYTFYCGVKGIAYVELRTKGAAHDLHSSLAPLVPNPAWRLVQALNTLKDGEDRLTIDGFMDLVRPPSPAELAYMRRIPFAGDQMKATWGIPAFLNNMSDSEALIAYLTQPTCTICGLRSGYGDEGAKTVLPSEALVKLDLRLVPDLTPAVALQLLRAHLDRRGFTDVEIVPSAGMIGMRSDVTAPVVEAAAQSARAVYGHEPVVYPSHAGSGPMYPLIQGVGTPGAIMAGVGYPGERMHAPDENIRMEDYFRHIEFLVDFYYRFAEA